MKTKEFFHQFDHEEIQEGVFMNGKYQVAYDHEEGKVYDIYVNTGLDCPQIWELVDLPGELYSICEQDLAEGL